MEDTKLMDRYRDVTAETEDRYQNHSCAPELPHEDLYSASNEDQAGVCPTYAIPTGIGSVNMPKNWDHVERLKEQRKKLHDKLLGTNPFNIQNTQREVLPLDGHTSDIKSKVRRGLEGKDACFSDDYDDIDTDLEGNVTDDDGEEEDDFKPLQIADTFSTDEDYDNLDKINNKNNTERQSSKSSESTKKRSKRKQLNPRMTYKKSALEESFDLCELNATKINESLFGLIGSVEQDSKCSTSQVVVNDKKSKKSDTDQEESDIESHYVIPKLVPVSLRPEASGDTLESDKKACDQSLNIDTSPKKKALNQKLPLKLRHKIVNAGLYSENASVNNPFWAISSRLEHGQTGDGIKQLKKKTATTSGDFEVIAYADEHSKSNDTEHQPALVGNDGDCGRGSMSLSGISRESSTTPALLKEKMNSLSKSSYCSEAFDVETDLEKKSLETTGKLDHRCTDLRNLKSHLSSDTEKLREETETYDGNDEMEVNNTDHTNSKKTLGNTSHLAVLESYEKNEKLKAKMRHMLLMKMQYARQRKMIFQERRARMLELVQRRLDKYVNFQKLKSEDPTFDGVLSEGNNLVNHPNKIMPTSTTEGSSQKMKPKCLPNATCHSNVSNLQPLNSATFANDILDNKCQHSQEIYKSKQIKTVSKYGSIDKSNTDNVEHAKSAAQGSPSSMFFKQYAADYGVSHLKQTYQKEPMKPNMTSESPPVSLRSTAANSRVVNEMTTKADAMMKSSVIPIPTGLTSHSVKTSQGASDIPSGFKMLPVQVFPCASSTKSQPLQVVRCGQNNQLYAIVNNTLKPILPKSSEHFTTAKPAKTSSSTTTSSTSITGVTLSSKAGISSKPKITQQVIAIDKATGKPIKSWPLGSTTSVTDTEPMHVKVFQAELKKQTIQSMLHNNKTSPPSTSTIHTMSPSGLCSKTVMKFLTSDQIQKVNSVQSFLSLQRKRKRQNPTAVTASSTERSPGTKLLDTEHVQPKYDKQCVELTKEDSPRASEKLEELQQMKNATGPTIEDSVKTREEKADKVIDGSNFESNNVNSADKLLEEIHLRNKNAGVEIVSQTNGENCSQASDDNRSNQNLVINENYEKPDNDSMKPSGDHSINSEASSSRAETTSLGVLQSLSRQKKAIRKKFLKTKFIILKGDMCDQWLDIKNKTGFKDMSDPNFVHYLLQLETLRQQHVKSTSQCCQKSIVTLADHDIQNKPSKTSVENMCLSDIEQSIQSSRMAYVETDPPNGPTPNVSMQSVIETDECIDMNNNSLIPVKVKREPSDVYMGCGDWQRIIISPDRQRGRADGNVGGTYRNEGDSDGLMVRTDKKADDTSGLLARSDRNADNTGGLVGATDIYVADTGGLMGWSDRNKVDIVGHRGGNDRNKGDDGGHVNGSKGNRVDTGGQGDENNRYDDDADGSVGGDSSYGQQNMMSPGEYVDVMKCSPVSGFSSDLSQSLFSSPDLMTSFKEEPTDEMDSNDGIKSPVLSDHSEDRIPARFLTFGSASKKRHHDDILADLPESKRRKFDNLTVSMKRNLRWTLTVLKDFLAEQGQTEVSILDQDAAWIDQMLVKFYTGARTKDNTPYSLDSLQSFRRLLSLYLGSCSNKKVVHKGISVDLPYSISNRALAEMGGIIRQSRQLQTRNVPISQSDLELLYTSRTLSDSNPSTLLRKVWFDITYHLCKCQPSRNFWRSMTKKSLVLQSDCNGVYYSFYNIAAGDTSVRMYATPSRPSRCPVRTTALYVSKLDPSCFAFFQYPKKDHVSHTNIWYIPVAISRDKLSQMMMKISSEANLSCVYTAQNVVATSLMEREKHDKA